MPRRASFTSARGNAGTHVGPHDAGPNGASPWYRHSSFSNPQFNSSSRASNNQQAEIERFRSIPFSLAGVPEQTRLCELLRNFSTLTFFKKGRDLTLSSLPYHPFPNRTRSSIPLEREWPEKD
ncbi:hypothetical protein CEXT_317141 [Caerostris extrusa]|uniref:Uncharacterized protein n=1 Tax=Caerostris extrusa TaxID=172846 RepID=A0AAV4T8T5_CAEEX|nr:hypothetical protein CEXT_317141 [Caerostris extrusa]